MSSPPSASTTKIGEKRLSRKRKKPSPALPPFSQSTTPNPSLPDDLVISCLARVPRLYYPTLSLVSKSFRTLVASPELYKTRSSLGRAESCLYVCLQDGDGDPNPRWFTLCRKPNRILANDITENRKKKKKKPSGYVLASIPVLQSRPVHWSGVAAVGYNIYNIGGPIDDAHSSRVSTLDCKSHTWHEGPRMRVERRYPTVNVLDGKLYVTGGCKDANTSNWMEVFDPKTETWELVPSPGVDGYNVHLSAGMEEQIFMFVNGKGLGLAYRPKDGKWNGVEWEMASCWVWYSYRVIDNVLYSHDDGVFKWYDTKVRVWRNLIGVKRLPKFARCGGKMVDFGGKIAVFWEKIVTSNGCKNKMIMCAVIRLERRSSEEILGKVEWQDAVHTVPMSYRVVYALSPTV